MSRNLVKPFFPIPPQQYDVGYFSEVIRSFSIYINQMQNPGEGRNTFTVFTDLQSNDYDLEPGTVFEHNGQLRIPVINMPYVAGSSALGEVGGVSVTT
jgi:hypothetical protein